MMLLEDESDASPQPAENGGACSAQFFAEHPETSAGDTPQGADEGEHGGLTGAGWPHNYHQFAGQDLCGHVEQNLLAQFSFAEVKIDPSQCDDSIGLGHVESYEDTRPIAARN